MFEILTHISSKHPLVLLAALGPLFFQNWIDAASVPPQRSPAVGEEKVLSVLTKACPWDSRGLEITKGNRVKLLRLEMSLCGHPEEEGSVRPVGLQMKGPNPEGPCKEPCGPGFTGPAGLHSSKHHPTSEPGAFPEAWFLMSSCSLCPSYASEQQWLPVGPSPWHLPFSWATGMLSAVNQHKWHLCVPSGLGITTNLTFFFMAQGSEQLRGRRESLTALFLGDAKCSQLEISPLPLV